MAIPVPARAERQAKRNEQAPKKNRVGERLWRAGESSAVDVERGQRTPQRVGSAALQLLGNRLQQPDLREHPKRPFRRTRTKDLVVLLEEPRRRAVRQLLAVKADRIEHRLVDGEAEA